MTAPRTPVPRPLRNWKSAIPPRITGALRFARSWLARFQRVPGRFSPLRLLPASTPGRPPTFASRPALHTWHHLALTLRTAFEPASPRPFQGFRSEPQSLAIPRPAFPMRPPTGALSISAAPGGPVSIPTPSLVQRALARNERREAMPSAGPRMSRSLPVAVPPDAFPPASTVSRTTSTPFGRPSPPLAAELPTRAPRPHAAPAAAVPEKPREQANQIEAPAGLPPHELERITGEVIRGIDRHLLAERERLGKF